MILGIDASRANVMQKTGVEWYAWRIIQEFKNIIPPDVRVILYSREPLEGALAKLPPLWESRVITTPFNRLWTHLGLAYEMFRRPPDVLFIPAHVLPLIHPRTVIALHDIASVRHPEYYRIFERWYHWWTTRYALRHAWRIITPSRFTAQEIQEVFGRGLSVATGPIEVIHLGSDASSAVTADNEASVPMIIPEEPYLLHIGRLERKKGTLDLLRAFEIVKEDSEHAALKLLLVGRPGVGFPEIEVVIANSPYRNDIHHLGWLPEPEKQRLLQAAHVFVFPSQYEGFGIPLLEAAACGVPVVARRAGSLPEIAGHDLVHWFDEPYELPLVLKDALLDLEWHHYVKSEGPKHATRFSWRAAAMRTWDVLRRALQNGRG
ncbi:MAG: glycosyltransferase family 4 protein [Candidatus Magasanikbacteria bacterium]|nr:glycosyltransferase family 4 protein [Candidatus Magasanikbacteria bacterium]